MKQRIFSLSFAVLMLLFILFIFWFALTDSSLRFQLEDTEISLETSYGRERKQQKEYEEVKTALPAARKELEALLPEVTRAEEEAAELKAARRKLRTQIAELTEEAAAEK